LAQGCGEAQARRAAGRKAHGWGIRDARGFTSFSMINGIENGSRTVFLTYLPFRLLNKGAGINLNGPQKAMIERFSSKSELYIKHKAREWEVGPINDNGLKRADI